MTALDGGALTLPSLPGPWNGEGEEIFKLALILEGEGFPCPSGFSRVVFHKTFDNTVDRIVKSLSASAKGGMQTTSHSLKTSNY